MRVIVIILALIASYQLLANRPQALAELQLETWLRAGLALLIITLAIPKSDASSQDSKRRILHSFRRPSWIDRLSIGAIILCIQILLLSVFTLAPQPATQLVEDTHEFIGIGNPSDRKTRTGQDPNAAAPNQLGQGGDGKWLWNNHFQRSHPKRVNHQPSNVPEIFLTLLDGSKVETLIDSPIYIKSFALDYFDGKQWSIYQPTKFVINNGKSSNIDFDTKPLTQLPIYFHRITQSHQQNGQNVFCSMHHPLRSNIETLTKVNTDTYLLPAVNEEFNTYNYDNTSQPRILREILKFDTNLAVGETDSVYLSQIPDFRLQQKISNFASRVATDLPLNKKLEAIRHLVQNQSSYSLQIVNRGDINPLENFLFEERRGYCEFFASATATLCRHHGIPSRIAFGWTGGKHYTGTKLFSFLSKNAHAWTEIYLEEYGWVVFDTTPSTAVPNSPSSDDEEPPELENMDYNQDYSIREPWFEITLQKAAIALATGVLLIIILLISRLKTTQKTSSSSSLHILHAPPAYIEQIALLCAKLGLSYRSSNTLQHHISKIKAHPKLAEIELTPSDLDRLLSYHYDITYRNTSADKAVETKFISILKKALRDVDEITS